MGFMLRAAEPTADLQPLGRTRYTFESSRRPSRPPCAGAEGFSRESGSLPSGPPPSPQPKTGSSAPAPPRGSADAERIAERVPGLLVSCSTGTFDAENELDQLDSDSQVLRWASCTSMPSSNCYLLIHCFF
ncbi:ribosomal protein 63, mitochondrial isoform X1 [Mastomys coucha]|uniref:ribosomal protein 63, mitochondrial isoform X1 n=1 Tax=Mastomys coucha TaxID=35658 RepID=UPI001261F2BD|nr:ribosomal protein 63, mitochondrial isoform X1 [Mastomys coucha]